MLVNNAVLQQFTFTMPCSESISSSLRSLAAEVVAGILL